MGLCVAGILLEVWTAFSNTKPQSPLHTLRKEPLAFPCPVPPFTSHSPTEQRRGDVCGCCVAAPLVNRVLPHNGNIQPYP